MVDVDSVKRFITKLDDLIGDAEYEDETIGAIVHLEEARDHVMDKINDSKRGIEREIRSVLDGSESMESKLDDIASIIEEAQELTSFLKARG
jgi:DNA-directed RNA polymerase subunit F